MNRKKLLPPMIGFVLVFLVSCASPSPEFPTGKFVSEPGQTLTFQFNEDGTWGLFLGNSEAPAVRGTYSVEGNLFTEETSNYSPCPYPATYTWTYDGQNLAFQLFGEDQCGERRSTYDGQTFTKSE